MPRRKTIALNIKIDKETNNKLRSLSDKTGISMAQLVADAINLYWELLTSSETTDE